MLRQDRSLQLLSVQQPEDVEYKVRLIYGAYPCVLPQPFRMPVSAWICPRASAALSMPVKVHGIPSGSVSSPLLRSYYNAPLPAAPYVLTYFSSYSTTNLRRNGRLRV